MKKDEEKQMTGIAHTECVRAMERVVAGLEQEVGAQKRFLEQVKKASDTNQAIEGMEAAIGSMDRVRWSTGDIVTAMLGLASAPADLSESR